MSLLAWFEVWALGLPTVYLFALFSGKRVRVRREAQAKSERSVAAIAERIERERHQEQRPARWPRADPDRGVVRDERPTSVLPVVEAGDSSKREQQEEDTVPVRARPYVGRQRNRNSITP